MNSTMKQLNKDSQNHDHFNKPIIICDFDGTISLKDVTDTLLNTFVKDDSKDLENKLSNGEIGSKEYISKKVASLQANQEEFDNLLDTFEIDSHFIEFANKNKHAIPIHIVSDGLDYAIRRILNGAGLDWLPVSANQLVYDKDRKWHINFPHANDMCIKGSGNCKCEYVNKCRSEYSSVLYVGDGASDYCVSHQVDLVFAKDKLVDYCSAHNINYSLITDFSDLVNVN